MRTESITTGMLIGEEWVESSGAGFEVLNPATGAVLATLPDGDADDVDRAVAAARAALPGWIALGGEQRGQLLWALADAIEERSGHIAELEASDNGRPIRETGAQARVVARWYRWFGGIADKLAGSTIPVEGPYLNYTRRVPVGVCAAITPWNHPMLIATKKVAPTLACGNTLVLKPSELAPLSVLELGRLAIEVGIPPGVLNIVTGKGATGAALAVHPGVDRIDVTGSTATGRAVATAAAQSLKRVGLELGGKAPNLIFEDADLQRAVRGALFGAFIGQGQTCVAGGRILVQRSVLDEVTEALKRGVDRIRLGDPLDQSTQMGPVITPAAAERIAGFVERAREDGASVLSDNRTIEALTATLDRSGFHAPTLIQTEDPGIEIARDEVFGPVAVIIPFETQKQAIEIANDVPFGLGAGIWTEDVVRAHQVAERLRCGITWINEYHRIDPASPWGGFGLSGYGRENGWQAVEMFTEIKSVWVPTERSPMDWYETDEEARLS
ncbi:MAG: aldehyde dehydrogenase family protein [Thermoleophilia bacterium]|nr:aldehyde dehydrogenase family protein [Thermoleophilia bacterium]